MASVIEDAETYQQSSLIVPSYNPIDSSNDLVPLTNPASCDLTAVRRTSSLGNISRGGIALYLMLFCVFHSEFVCIGTSTLGTIFLIVNAALGAGLLNFPKAFDQAGGVEVALVVQAFLVVFVIISLLVLAKCSDINGAGTVQVCVFRTEKYCTKVLLL